ncbi:hypothetical protein ACFS7Z_22020 [Pontibacter toksunensis]|uniref:Uncharacterized protein n=1 Tax=Pontibacter toksunensis TaxID=1332631 RepID=A0ABW6C1A2_9BACT
MFPEDICLLRGSVRYGFRASLRGTSRRHNPVPLLYVMFRWARG